MKPGEVGRTLDENRSGETSDDSIGRDMSRLQGNGKTTTEL